MTEITKHETLSEAVCHAMLEMTYVGKGETNRQEGYSFRSVDDAMAGVRGPLLRHGVVPHVTFGRVEPVNDLDPYFWRLPIKLTLLHAHSGETLVSEIDGLGRQAGKGNVTNPDPRAVGQAASYGIKTLLINSFMLAGGDDSADQAPHQQEPARSLRSEPQQQPRAEPETERRRVDLLDAIAAATPDVKDALGVWCRQESYSVRNGDFETLELVAKQMEKIEARFAVKPSDGPVSISEVLDEVVADLKGPTPEDDEWIPESEYADGVHEVHAVSPAPALTELLTELVEANLVEEVFSGNDGDEVLHGSESPERHLEVVPEPEPEPERPARKARAKPAARTPDVNIVPPGDDHEFGLTDQQFAYLIATGGTGTTPASCNGDRETIKEGLRLFTGLRTGRMHRQGTSLVDSDGQEIVDGSDAVARHQES